MVDKVRCRAFNVRLAERGGGVGEETHKYRMTPQRAPGPAGRSIENEIESTGFEKATRYCSSGSGKPLAGSPNRPPWGSYVRGDLSIVSTSNLPAEAPD